MSTRGLVGFVVDGQVKCTYNHSDSYPTYTGLRIAEFVREVDAVDGWDDVAAAARSLKLIDPDSGRGPSEDEKLHLMRWANFSVNAQSSDDWYCLLRGTQGRPDEMLACGIIEDSTNFGLYSTWCEWGYLIDLDRRVLEVYRGSLHEMHNQGRWVDGRLTWPDDECERDEQGRSRGQLMGEDELDVPIRLIAEIDFEDLWSASDNEQLMDDLQTQGREMAALQWESYKRRVGL